LPSPPIKRKKKIRGEGKKKIEEKGEKLIKLSSKDQEENKNKIKYKINTGQDKK